jgi:hypothetical protein
MTTSEPALLTNPLEVKGHWWLPESPEGQVAGALLYDPDDGLSLELLGTLTGGSFEVDVPVILGEAKDGTPVSLLRSFPTQLSLGGPAQERMHCHHALVGAHLPSDGAPSINQVAVHFPGIEDWSCAAPFQHHLADPSSGTQSQAITWQPVEETSPQRVDTPRGTIQVRHTVRSTNNFVTEARLQHRAYLVISPDQAMDPSAAIKLAWSVQGLYVLLSGASLDADEVRLRTTTGDGCSVLGARWSRSAKTVPPLQLMPLPFNKTKDSLGQVVGAWFKLTQNSKQAVDLFMSVMFRANALLETNFLALAQGLEAFHRYKYPDATQLPQADFVAFRDHMVAQVPDVPEAFRQGFLQRLEHSNEPSLRHRIKQLLDLAGTPIRNALGIEAKEFVNDVVDARNALTHSVSQKAAGTVRGLFDLNAKMRKLTATLFLLEIGVPAGTLESKIRRAW